MIARLKKVARSVRRLAGKLRPEPLHRFNVRTPAQAARVLASLADDARRERQGVVLLVGGEAPYAALVREALRGRGVQVREVVPSALAGMTSDEWAGVGAIALASLDSRTQLNIARQLVAHPHAGAIPLEYLALPQHENQLLHRWDRYRDGDFVSPLLGRFGGLPYEIYRESLTRFRQKTDIRDFLDFCQILDGVAQRAVPGNVAEFGSFKGHSGYLMSRFLEAIDSDKTLFMFDMFENFPEEEVGVDRFWSGTHKVDFAQVRKAFHDRRNVRLVKGDFTQTVRETDTGPLAFAFIDCDSYRATRVLLDYLWRERLSPGGVIALEDYGHAALLGNRVAVHEFFDGRRDAATFFSSFSGFFVATKLPGIPPA